MDAISICILLNLFYQSLTGSLRTRRPSEGPFDVSRTARGYRPAEVSAPSRIHTHKTLLLLVSAPRCLGGSEPSRRRRVDPELLSRLLGCLNSELQSEQHESLETCAISASSKSKSSRRLLRAAAVMVRAAKISS